MTELCMLLTHQEYVKKLLYKSFNLKLEKALDITRSYKLSNQQLKMMIRPTAASSVPALHKSWM